jgi:hypothetical protein
LAERVDDGLVVAGLVVDEADDPEVGGAPEPVDPVPGGGPAATDVEEEPRLPAPGRPLRVGLADFVWKLRTPTSPAAVAAMTIGARLIEGILSISTSGQSLLA